MKNCDFHFAYQFIDYKLFSTRLSIVYTTLKCIEIEEKKFFRKSQEFKIS